MTHDATPTPQDGLTVRLRGNSATFDMQVEVVDTRNGLVARFPYSVVERAVAEKARREGAAQTSAALDEMMAESAQYYGVHQ